MAERETVRITGTYALSALGRGADALLAGVLTGTPAFAPVRRFDTTGRRVTVAATLPDVGTLAGELTDAIDTAARAAGLDRAGRAESALFLATHGGPYSLPVPQGWDEPTVPALAGHLAARCGLG
ncbi:beta-ketoacyl-[acyl-carrier-protein] synthase family protein, partial [Micromonospora aurantiaca]